MNIYTDIIGCTQYILTNPLPHSFHNNHNIPPITRFKKQIDDNSLVSRTIIAKRIYLCKMCFEKFLWTFFSKHAKYSPFIYVSFGKTLGLRTSREFKFSFSKRLEILARNRKWVVLRGNVGKPPKHAKKYFLFVMRLCRYYAQLA